MRLRRFQFVSMNLSTLRAPASNTPSKFECDEQSAWLAADQRVQV